MKRTLIALAITLATAPAMAQGPIIKDEISPGQYSYWQGGQYLGSSTRSRGGRTETFWPHRNYGYQSQSGCCYNRPFAEGYQMGRDIRGIFRALSGSR